MVAAATHNLCEAANALVKGHTSEEKLIGAAKQVAGSTAQLLLACKVKADPDSNSMKRLEAASNAVRKATDNLVKAAQTALEQEEQANDVSLNSSAVNNIAAEINARAEVLLFEKKLEQARSKLGDIHKRRYQTDSETEQSGYESSGYDESSFRKVYHSSPYPRKASQVSQRLSEEEENVQQHTIESGPSFNESLERFRLATSSGNESDGDIQTSSAAMFQSRQASQQMSQQMSQQQQHYRSTNIQKTALTTRSVEEQRTIITRNSQKSYHIE
jgi:talin